MNRIFVAALKEETQNLNFFFHTGAGKINATYNLTKLINEKKPKEKINFGTAGAVTKMKKRSMKLSIKLLVDVKQLILIK